MRRESAPDDWCCLGLKGAYEDRGERGIAVHFEKVEQGSFAFILEARAVSEEDETNNPPLNTEFPVAITTTVYIHNCPWCGISLKNFYQPSRFG